MQVPAPAVPKRVYSYREVLEKRENAKGIKDVSKLIEMAADDEERMILEDCRARLQAKAKGEKPPVQRKEDALLALANA